MAQVALIVGTIWLIFSVWVDSGVFENGVWAGLLPVTYLICFCILAISNPFYEDGDRD